jgi:hypothetical protein
LLFFLLLFFSLLFLIEALNELLGLHLVLNFWLSLAVVDLALGALAMLLHLLSNLVQNIEFKAFGTHLVEYCHLKDVGVYVEFLFLLHRHIFILLFLGLLLHFLFIQSLSRVFHYFFINLLRFLKLRSRRICL